MDFDNFFSFFESHSILAEKQQTEQINYSSLSLSASLNTLHSMTTLLTHTVAHSTKPSFRPKTNNQPPKKLEKIEASDFRKFSCTRGHEN